jgi:MFS family permease
MKLNYGKNFWLLCLSMFLFMAGFNLIMPDLNQFITNLGGKEQKGLIITLFTISAGLSRPFSGKLSDTIGRKKVIYIGAICSTIVAMLYPLSETVFFFLLLRFFHGFSAGFTPTGATALLTDIVPSDRRGSAMGIWGTFISLGIGAGQSLGAWICSKYGFNILFSSAAICSILSIIVFFEVKESLFDPIKYKSSILKLKWNDVFEPSVRPAAVVMFLTAISSGIIFVITPDISEFLKIDNKGFFFGIYVVSTIIIRLLTSSISDRIGRRQMLLAGCFLLVVSMLLIAISESVSMYITAAIVFGFATGVSSPTLFAWTADLSHEARRGVGAGTMFIALESGIMTGSLSTLFTYRNTPSSVFITFSVGAFFALLAGSYLIWHIRTQKSQF